MIDFSGLYKLNGAESHQDAPEQPQAGGVYTNTTPPQSGSQPPKTGEFGRLQQQADKSALELQRAREVYKAYQANILAAGTLKNDILKGIDRGESLYNLLLKAGEAIARTTGDSVFSDVLKRKLIEVRGLGLGDPEPLDGERQDIKARLDKLHAALEREQGTDRESGIKWAIRAHEQELKRVEKLLEQARDG